MLEPKKVKYRRHHRGNRRGMASRGSHVAFGSFGLKAVTPGWITSRQIEAARITISRVVRKTGKMWTLMGFGDTIRVTLHRIEIFDSVKSF